jgi:hypothetical protein
MQEGLRQLETLLDPYDWFYEVCAEDRRYVVYVSYMDGSQDTIIPDWMHGKQVVVHFASNSPGATNSYVNQVSTRLPLYTPTSEEKVDIIPDLDDEEAVAYHQKLGDTEDVNLLCRALDRLEKDCGSNILQDIFYEIHDGKNAVTNLRSKFPDVHQGLLKLYNEYGFDTIYNELDG